MDKQQETHVTDLKRFFAPSSVALVGATEELTRFGGRCLQRMLAFGYTGRVFPINPRYQELQGLTCYPSIAEVPEAPDHVGVVVPAERVLGVLKDCAVRGARFATVYTGGFAEAGTDEGRAMQSEISALARDSGMRVMGPNCNGMINFVDAFAMTTTATIAGPRKPAGNVGIVSQSGGLAQVNVMWRAQELGIGISYEVSCGNCADLDVLDFVQFMIDDAATDVVLVLAEHITDGARKSSASALVMK
jgi:acyl-CoA synthetase (NDP forming)